MTIQNYVAGQTIRMASAMAHFIGTSHQDRLDWQPSAENGAETRSMLEQVSECVLVNHLIATTFRGEKVDAGLSGRPKIEFADAEDAQQQLLASAEDLASAIQGLSDADLDREFHHPRGLILGSNMILMAYRNMAYHAGQINFIQTLYGDTEFHLPPNWR